MGGITINKDKEKKPHLQQIIEKVQYVDLFKA